MLQCAYRRAMTRNTAYLTVILVLLTILQNVKSRKLALRNGELKPNSKRMKAVDKLDFSMFVDHLIKSAKMIENNIKTKTILDEQKTKTILDKPQTKSPQKKKTVYETHESNYDSLGIDENMKEQIVRANTKTESLSLNEMQRLFQASNDALAYKNKGDTLRSGGGLSLTEGNEQDGKLFRSLADEPSKEEGSKLIFDLEEDEDVDNLKHPLY